MRILIACEYSGIVRDAFKKRGHYVVSCDLLPSESNGWHYMGDVFDIINDGWDMMICFPTCTKLTWANWNVPIEDRIEAARFAIKLWESPIEKICMENPRGYLTKAIRPADQELHPWHFGDYYYKRTQLWLKNLPPLLPYCSGISKPPTRTWINKNGKKKYERDLGIRKSGKERSRFHYGFAQAMAEQWG
jgi:hypothetical protein